MNSKLFVKGHFHTQSFKAWLRRPLCDANIWADDFSFHEGHLKFAERRPQTSVLPLLPSLSFLRLSALFEACQRLRKWKSAKMMQFHKPGSALSLWCFQKRSKSREATQFTVSWIMTTGSCRFPQIFYKVLEWHPICGPFPRIVFQVSTCDTSTKFKWRRLGTFALWDGRGRGRGRGRERGMNWFDITLIGITRLWPESVA